MARRRLNPQLIKLHRNYSVEEAASALGAHKNTVRNLVKQGLPLIDARRPALILGEHLVAFLQARRKSQKQACRPGEIYCVKCRKPQQPAGNMADYVPITLTSGNLRAICPACETLIHRRVNIGKIALVSGDLDIAYPEAPPHIGGRATPSVNCDFGKES